MCDRGSGDGDLVVRYAQGLLVCYETDTGDATLMWTFDGETLVGKAIRDDRNMTELLAWWADVARFGPS